MYNVKKDKKDYATAGGLIQIHKEDSEEAQAFSDDHSPHSYSNIRFCCDLPCSPAHQRKDFNIQIQWRIISILRKLWDHIEFLIVFIVIGDTVYPLQYLLTKGHV